MEYIHLYAFTNSRSMANNRKKIVCLEFGNVMCMFFQFDKYWSSTNFWYFQGSLDDDTLIVYCLSLQHNFIWNYNWLLRGLKKIFILPFYEFYVGRGKHKHTNKSLQFRLDRWLAFFFMLVKKVEVEEALKLYKAKHMYT